jgi:hypothetical protein
MPAPNTLRRCIGPYSRAMRRLLVHTADGRTVSSGSGVAQRITTRSPFGTGSFTGQMGHQTQTETAPTVPTALKCTVNFGLTCGKTIGRAREFDVERATREVLEEQLVSSYESYVALKSMMRQPEFRTQNLQESLGRELQLQRYLHALLGYRGEPPGLLY